MRMIRVSVIWKLLQLQYTVAYYPADSAPSEEEMDIDAFDLPVKDKEKSYQVDFTTLSKRDVQKAMDDNIEYITGIFGLEVRKLRGHSDARVSDRDLAARGGFNPPATLRMEQGKAH